jgi:catechol 2,3-dioxygenase-like lactoylglutathione lyase family enzyme
MAIKRMDNVLIVVDDLDAVIAFLVELGMELENRGPLEGDFAERVIGLKDVRQEVAMLRVPGGGYGRIELARFDRPRAVAPEPRDAPANTLGLRRVMFAVDDIEDTITRLRGVGGELVGEVVRYEDIFLLAYVRGPEGIVLGLAEELA